MQAQMKSSHTDIVEKLIQEFNGHSIYGVEFILDELYQKTNPESLKQDDDKVDWFGLSDLSI